MSLDRTDDIDAIKRFVDGQRSLVSTHSQLGPILQQWDAFYNGLGFWKSDADFDKARLLRDKINGASGAPDLVSQGFQPADDPANQLPLDQILGKTSAEIAKAQAALDAKKAATGQAHPLLYKGNAKNDKAAVMVAQKFLNLKQTGTFDTAMENAVKALQTKSGFTGKNVDGKIGPLTWALWDVIDVQVHVTADPVAAQHALPSAATDAFAPPGSSTQAMPSSITPPPKPQGASPAAHPGTVRPGVSTPKIAPRQDPPPALQASMLGNVPWWGWVLGAVGIGTAVTMTGKPTHKR